MQHLMIALTRTDCWEYSEASTYAKPLAQGYSCYSPTPRPGQWSLTCDLRIPLHAGTVPLIASCYWCWYSFLVFTTLILYHYSGRRKTGKVVPLTGWDRTHQCLVTYYYQITVQSQNIGIDNLSPNDSFNISKKEYN